MVHQRYTGCYGEDTDWYEEFRTAAVLYVSKQCLHYILRLIPYKPVHKRLAAMTRIMIDVRNAGLGQYDT